MAGVYGVIKSPPHNGGGTFLFFYPEPTKNEIVSENEVVKYGRRCQVH